MSLARTSCQTISEMRGLQGNITVEECNEKGQPAKKTVVATMELVNIPMQFYLGCTTQIP